MILISPTTMLVYEHDFASAAPGGLVKTQVSGPGPRVADLKGLSGSDTWHF